MTTSRKVKVATKPVTKKATQSIADTGRAVKKATKKVLSFFRYVGATLRGSSLRAYWVATLKVTGQVTITKEGIIKASTKKPTIQQITLGRKLLDTRRNHAPKGNVTTQGAITSKGIAYINSDMKFDPKQVETYCKAITASKAGSDYIKVSA